MVRPIVEYMPAQFGHHMQERAFKVLRQYKERQASMLKMTIFTSNVTAMMQDLGWPTLEKRGWSLKAIMLFKILHNMVCIPADQYLSTTTGHIGRHQSK